MTTWFDYKLYQHYEMFEQLRDVIIPEYKEWSATHNPKKDAQKFSDRYGCGEDLGWYACPLIDARNVRKDFPPQWPKTMEILSALPGILNSAINFVEPGTVVPPHVDDEYDMHENIQGKGVQGWGTMIGVSMPSNDPAVMGFKVGEDVMSWNTGEIVSFNGYALHEGWNYSNEWRVTIVIEIDKKYWNIN